MLRWPLPSETGIIIRIWLDFYEDNMSPWVLFLSSIHIQQLELCSCARLLPQVSGYISWVHWRYAPLPDHCHRSVLYISGHSHSIGDMLLCQTTATGQWVHFLDTVTPRDTCFTTAICQQCPGLHGVHALVPSPENLYRQLAKYTVTLLLACWQCTPWCPTYAHHWPVGHYRMNRRQKHKGQVKSHL
jgi:hypothetical protein